MKIVKLILISAFLFCAVSASANETRRFVFLAPDALTPVNAAIYNGMRDAFKEFKMRYGKTFEVEYASAAMSAQKQETQLGNAYIGNFSGAIIFPVSQSESLADKISELSKNKFYVAVVGRDLSKSSRLCFVGGDSKAMEKTVSERIKSLSGSKKVSLFCYFKNGGAVEKIPASEIERVSPFLEGELTVSQFENIIKPYGATLVAVDYYSIYARQNEIEIMRRDDYGEIFFSPYLFADMQPVKRDSDRAFALCVGAVPQLERYLADGFLSACVYDDYYGWGYFAARALVEKVMDGANPPVKIRLTKPILATPDTLDSFVSDWRKWIK